MQPYWVWWHWGIGAVGFGFHQAWLHGIAWMDAFDPCTSCSTSVDRFYTSMPYGNCTDHLETSGMSLIVISWVSLKKKAQAREHECDSHTSLSSMLYLLFNVQELVDWHPNDLHKSNECPNQHKRLAETVLCRRNVLHSMPSVWTDQTKVNTQLQNISPQ